MCYKNSTLRSCLIAGCLAAALACGTATTARAGQRDTVPFRREAEAFVARLIDALASGNRRQVAALFAYPIKVQVAGLGNPVSVDNAASLVKYYDAFFGADLRCGIELSRVPVAGAPAPAHKLLIADGAVSIDNGRLVAARSTGGVLKINRMSVPVATPSGKARPPRTVTFAMKGLEAQYMGRLAHEDVDAYLVTARKGQTLEARIDRFAGSALALTVLPPVGLAPNALRATETARTWKAIVPETGSYRIEVAKQSGFCAPDLTYLIGVTLR